MPFSELLDLLRDFSIRSRSFTKDEEFNQAMEVLKLQISDRPNGHQIVALIDWDEKFYETI